MNPAILDGLKRVNASVNEEKTKERVERVWKSAPKDLKHRITEKYEIGANTIYRIFRTGTITPKTAVIMASVLGVDPAYFTGDSDDDSSYNEQLLDSFLRNKGYDKLLDDIGFKPKRKYQRRDPVPASDDTEATSPCACAQDDEPENQESVSIMEDVNNADTVADVSEDELVLLVRSLCVRARYNQNAKERLNAILNTLLID